MVDQNIENRFGNPQESSTPARDNSENPFTDFEKMFGHFGVKLPSQHTQPTHLNPALQTVLTELHSIGISSVQSVPEIPAVFVGTSAGYLFAVGQEGESLAKRLISICCAPAIDDERVLAFSDTHRILIVRGTQEGLSLYQVDEHGYFLKISSSSIEQILAQNVRDEIEINDLVEGCAVNRAGDLLVLRFREGELAFFSLPEFKQLAVKNFSKEKESVVATIASEDGDQRKVSVLYRFKGRLSFIEEEVRKLDLADIVNNFESLREKIELEKVSSFSLSRDGRWVAFVVDNKISDEEILQQTLAAMAARFGPSGQDDDKGQKRIPHIGYLLDLENRCGYVFPYMCKVILSGDDKYLSVTPPSITQFSTGHNQEISKPRLYLLGKDVQQIDTSFILADSPFSVARISNSVPDLVVHFKLKGEFVRRYELNEVPSDVNMIKSIKANFTF